MKTVFTFYHFLTPCLLVRPYCESHYVVYAILFQVQILTSASSVCNVALIMRDATAVCSKYSRPSSGSVIRRHVWRLSTSIKQSGSVYPGQSYLPLPRFTPCDVSVPLDSASCETRLYCRLSGILDCHHIADVKRSWFIGRLRVRMADPGVLAV